MTFEAVIFDLFGTLINDFASSVGEMHAEMAAALAAPYERFTPLWNQTTEMRIIGAFDTVEGNIEHVLAALNLRAEAEQIRKAVEIRMKYIRQALQPRPGAIDTLTQLKNRVDKIGLISNCSIEIPMLWQETAFANVVDTPIFSCVAHLKKPDIRIYHFACERLGVIPASCLYIADGENHELAAAAKAGLHPVLIRNSSRDNRSELLREAREWQGTTIASVTEVLPLIRH